MGQTSLQKYFCLIIKNWAIHIWLMATSLLQTRQTQPTLQNFSTFGLFTLLFLGNKSHHTQKLSTSQATELGMSNLLFGHVNPWCPMSEAIKQYNQSNETSKNHIFCVGIEENI